MRTYARNGVPVMLGAWGMAREGKPALHYPDPRRFVYDFGFDLAWVRLLSSSLHSLCYAAGWMAGCMRD